MRKMQNFHGMFAVISGLTHRSVERMTDTMKFAMKTNTKRKRAYQEMVGLCDISGDYKNYRPVLAAAADECVPFIGCLQKDLIYISESFPNKIDDLINFNKCRMCAELIEKVKKYTQKRYFFNLVPHIQEMISSIPEPPDTVGLMQLSMDAEKKKK